MEGWQTSKIESPRAVEPLIPGEPDLLDAADMPTLDVAIEASKIALPEPKQAVNHVAKRAIIDFSR